MMPPPPVPPGQPYYVYISRPTDGQATAALVLGILSLVGVMCYGVPSLIMGPIAIYLGLHSSSRIRGSGGALGGQGFAMAGWICGSIGVLLGALYIVFFIGIMAIGIWAMMNAPSISPTPTPLQP
jgi:Domain of unknown function (DUF4190)